MTIKFSHVYKKMPPSINLEPTYLVGVSVCDIEKLPVEFLVFDTAILSGGAYPLPKKGKYIVLTLNTGIQTWTTIRRWTHRKYTYYADNLGQLVNVAVVEEADKDWGKDSPLRFDYQEKTFEVEELERITKEKHPVSIEELKEKARKCRETFDEKQE